MGSRAPGFFGVDLTFATAFTLIVVAHSVFTLNFSENRSPAWGGSTGSLVSGEH